MDPHTQRLSRIGNGALLVATLVTAGCATYVAAAGVLDARGAAARAAEAKDYSSIAAQVTAERQLLARPQNAASLRRLQRLDAGIVGLFFDLQRRAGDDHRAQVSTLSASYRAATAGRGSPAALRAVAAQADAILRARQQSWARHGGFWSSPARLVSGAAASAGALLLLAFALATTGGPLRRRREERDAELARLEEAAHTDILTGLGNRRAFHHELTNAIRERTAFGTTFSLMAIDLDGLKQINDSKGHQAGDRYIRRVSEILVHSLKEQGTVYRTGGDEFMALLPGRRSWHALAVARRVDQLTASAFGRRAVSTGVTESIATEAAHTLIEQADLALYEAKRTKLTAVTYHPGLAKPPASSTDAPSHHQKTLAAALARAVDAKDVGTRGHSETVAELAAAIGTRLGIEGERLERLRVAALLHDVGKIGVPDTILQKPGPLDCDEQEQMKEHVSIGHGILHAAELPVEAEWVLYHHERFDGDGYPAGLEGEEVPLESRIIAVADAFEAMTGGRPYRKATLLPEDALAELERQAGSQFDAGCVAALAEAMDLLASTEAVPDWLAGHESLRGIRAPAAAATLASA